MKANVKIHKKNQKSMRESISALFDRISESSKKHSKSSQEIKTERKNMIKNNKDGKKSEFEIHESIVLKLIISFLIPVVFVIVIGVVSYEKAATSIINNYKQSSLQSMKMMSEYMGFAFDSVELKGMQYITNADIIKYFSGIKDIDKGASIKSSIHSKLLAEQISDSLLTNIHILSDSVDTMTTGDYSEKNMYSSFLSSQGGKKLFEKKDAKYWIGSDDYLDKVLRTNKNNYAIRYVCGFSMTKACVIFDVSRKSLENIMQDLNFGEDSITGFVTADQRELILGKSGSKEGQIFSKEKFYKQAVSSEQQSGSKDVRYKGKDYLFLSSKIGDTNAMLCTLIPEDRIISKAKDIKIITFILVTLSSLIAVLIGLFMASGIKKVIHYIIVELDKVSKGNLMVRMEVKNKDEFNALALGINCMIDNMRKLIEKVMLQTDSVTVSSDKVTGASEIFTKATQEISESIHEIQEGVSQQAQDAEKCLQQMDKLSQKIQVVSGKTEEISKIALITKDSVMGGIDSMNHLNERAVQTSQITARVRNNIELLNSKSKSISLIIETINSIAQQTNLLSLNASIEAARAGDAGRGFNVVAEEIRKLADQSMKSVKEIAELIKEIQAQTKITVTIANEADGVVSEQEEAVNHTTQSLQLLSGNVEELIGNVKLITDSIENIDSARAGTLSAIENISAVSQQTAAATISVNDTTAKQMDAVVSLNELSKELDENAQALENEVKLFVVE